VFSLNVAEGMQLRNIVILDAIVLAYLCLFPITVPCLPPHEDGPDYWATYGWIFSSCLLLWPSATLLSYCRISWTNLRFVCFTILSPESTAISLFLEGGYYTNHKVLLLFYIAWVLYIRVLWTPSSQSQTAVDYIVPAPLMNAMAHLVQTVASLKQQVLQQQSIVGLLRGDGPALRSLNFNQLKHLEDDVEAQLQRIKRAQHKAQRRPSTIMRIQDCAICLSEPSAVELHPCGHTPMCSSCFDEFNDSDNSETCPICRLPILSHRYTTTYATTISQQQYRDEMRATTDAELAQLNTYVHNNPGVFDQLHYTTRDSWNARHTK